MHATRYTALALLFISLGSHVALAQTTDAGTADGAAAGPADGGVGDLSPAADLPADAAPTAPDLAPAPEPAPVEDTKGPFTGVKGKVLDKKTGEAIIEATVKVTRGPAKQVLTDVDGNYSLRLPPGNYDLRVFYEVYKPRRFGNVIVERGKVTVLDIELGADDKAIQEVVVEVKAEKRSEVALLQERKKAAVVSDAISAQEMQRSPDTNASDAVKRVVAATVRDNRYLFVRGLGGRYTSTLINGTDLPSVDPDEQSVALDIFPTTLLSNLNIAKTYSPEMPGSFSGGVTNIETNSFPTKLEAKVKFSTEFNSETSFRDFQTYRGGKWDAIGVDDGTRGLPKSLPKDKPLDTMFVPRPEIDNYAKQFSNIWKIQQETGLPSFGISASVGSSYKLGKSKERSIGFLVSANYGYGSSTRREDVTLVEPDRANNLRFKTITSNNSINSGALVNIGGALSRNHEWSLLSFVVRDTDISTSWARDAATLGESIQSQRLRFIERTISYTQLRFEHKFPTARNLLLRWQANFSYGNRNEPDTRDLYYGGARGMIEWQEQAQSGERFFSNLVDKAGGFGAHFSLPLRRLTLRWGAIYQMTDRRFASRRFRYVRNPSADPTVFREPAEVLFADENQGPSVRMREATLPSDAYDAQFLLWGGYVMTDVEVTKPVHVILGLRYEGAKQELVNDSPFATGGTAAPNVSRIDHHPIPSVNAVWNINSKMNLRAAYSYTLTRPKFRELAPFNFYDFQRQRNFSGNPNLKDTTIHNADLRWEFFPGENGVVSVSAFYKNFREPIEVVIVNDGGDLTLRNTDQAHLFGVEAEARTSLRYLHKRLRDFTVGFNGTYVYSRVKLRPEDATLLTSKSRAMQGQAPFVVNLFAGWSSEKTGTEAQLLYNVAGAKISDVGALGFPDIYERPFHRLDVSVSQRLGKGFRLKAAGTNLANQRLTFKQGADTRYAYRPGVNAYIAIEWQH